MKHDPFDLLSPDLTPLARLWRVAFIAAIVAVSPFYAERVSK